MDLYLAAPFRGLLSHDTEAPADNNVGVLAGIATAVAPSFTEGNQVGLSTDLAGNLRIVEDNSVARDVNIDQVAGAAITVGQGAVTANTQRVTIATDDILTISANENPNDLTNPIATILTDGTNAIGTATNPIYVVADGTPGTSKASTLKEVDVPAGGSATLAADIIAAGVTGRLLKVVVSSSIRYKAVVQKFDGTTATDLEVQFGSVINSNCVFEFSDASRYSLAGAANARYRVVVTNLEPALATADVYATVEWTEA